MTIRPYRTTCRVCCSLLKIFFCVPWLLSLAWLFFECAAWILLMASCYWTILRWTNSPTADPSGAIGEDSMMCCATAHCTHTIGRLPHILEGSSERPISAHAPPIFAKEDVWRIRFLTVVTINGFWRATPRASTQTTGLLWLLSEGAGVWKVFRKVLFMTHNLLCFLQTKSLMTTTALTSPWCLRPTEEANHHPTPRRFMT